jgi:hypothetical protein
MTKGGAVLMLGLLIALGGAGGVEHALNNWQVFGSFLISLGGCCLMFAGVIILRIEGEN